MKRVVEEVRKRRNEETRLRTKIIITDECLAQLGTNCVTVRFDSVDKADFTCSYMVYSNECKSSQPCELSRLWTLQ